MIFVLIAVIVVYALMLPTQMSANATFLFFSAAIWAPIVFGRFAALAYVKYRRMDHYFSQQTVLLELVLPNKALLKSPAAMETLFSSIFIGGGEGTWWKKFVLGATRPNWSFEIASLGGTIHYYVRTRTAFRRGVEQYLYGQYPTIEIIEVEDYALLRDPSDDDVYSVFAVEYEYASKSSSLPIKTYVGHGLQEAVRPTEKQYDPLVQTLEFLSGIQKEEQIWIQFGIRTTKNEKYRGKNDGKYTWKDAAKEEVKKDEQKKGLVDAKLSKPVFDVAIRTVYSAPKDLKAGNTAAFIVGLFNPFNETGHNTLGPANTFSIKYSGDPWEDIGGKWQKRDMKKAVKAYRLRSFFYYPYRGPWIEMNTEELATLYHLPISTTLTKGSGTADRRFPVNLPQ